MQARLGGDAEIWRWRPTLAGAEGVAMRSSGVFFAVLVTGFLSAVFLLLVFESWALITGQKPITDYVHETVHSYPGWAFALAIVFGILIGHVLWGAPGARLNQIRSQP